MAHARQGGRSVRHGSEGRRVRGARRRAAGGGAPNFVSKFPVLCLATPPSARMRAARRPGSGPSGSASRGEGQGKGWSGRWARWRRLQGAAGRPASAPPLSGEADLGERPEMNGMLPKKAKSLF